LEKLICGVFRVCSPTAGNLRFGDGAFALPEKKALKRTKKPAIQEKTARPEAPGHT
jgi:hypothetical protein